VTSNVRAFTLGTATIAAITAAAFLSLYVRIVAGGLLMWASLLIGGFVTARLAASHKLLLATALVLPGAAILALFNWIWHVVGQPADFTGVGGAFIVVLMTIPFGAVLCLVGGALGFVSVRRMTPNKSLERTRER
jgi:hypothetical protein